MKLKATILPVLERKIGQNLSFSRALNRQLQAESVEIGLIDIRYSMFVYV